MKNKIIEKIKQDLPLTTNELYFINSILGKSVAQFKLELKGYKL